MREKEFAKNTLIIVIGKILTQMLSFILLPLYTSVLSTEEYGVVDLVLTYVQLLLPIVTLMVEQAAFRYLIEINDKVQKMGIISSSLSVILVICVIYLGIIILLSSSFKYYIFFMLLSASLANWSLQIARGIRDTFLFTVGSLVMAIFTLCCNVILLVVLKQGIEGMLISSIIGNTACFIFMFLKLHLYEYINVNSVNMKAIKNLVNYSIPLIPNQLSFWLINFSDRLIVNFCLGDSANGILAISHRFPSIYTTFFSMFLLSWQELLSLHYCDNDRDEFITSMYNRMIQIFGALCILLMAVLPLVFPILVGKDFEQAYYTIPIYLYASLLNSVIGLLGAIYVANKKTTEMAKTSFICGVINVLIHLGLIEFVGLYAAALSTLFSYFFIVIYRIWDVRKYVLIRHNYFYYFILSVTFLICTIIYFTKVPLIQIVGFIIAILFALFYNIDYLKKLKKIIEDKINI